MILSCTLDTPLGKMQAAAKDSKLCGLWFIGQKHFPQNTDKWLMQADYPVFISLKTWIDCYFSKLKNKPEHLKELEAHIPLSPAGTDFQQTVWKLLCKIPYGATCTYGDIAKKLVSLQGNKKRKTGNETQLTNLSSPGIYSRAVASAIGRNPVSLIIPCHRVIGADGKLHGYAGGIERKQALLELESGAAT